MTSFGEDLDIAVEALHRAHLALRKLTGNATDAVVHGPSSTTYLFPEMQMELHRLARAERRLATERAAILDALPAQLAILDEAGTIVAVNEAWRAFARAQNYPDQTAAVGVNYLDICLAAERDGDDVAVKVFRGLEQVLAGAEDEFTLEYSCLTPEALLWFHQIVVPVRSGERAGAVVMHMDITARHAAEAREAELRGRFERMMDQAGIGVLIHSDYVPIFANPTCVKILGFEGPDDILALSDIRTLFDLRDGTELGAPGGDAGAHELIATVHQIAGRRRNDRPIKVGTRVFSMTWGTVSAVCVMISDITDRLWVEDQLRAAQRLEAVGQLTGGIAHDFNNLLTVMLGSGDMLVEALQHDPHLVRLADQIVMMAERGADLTKRLLAFARLQPLNPHSTDVNQRLATIEDLLQRTLGAAIEITLDLSKDTWPAMIDAGGLDNAILNLSINARDAMPSGGHLTIRTRNVDLDAQDVLAVRDALPGAYVVVSVIDDGTGMTEATLARIFEPFFTTKDVGKGSGLGLSMVFGFVKQSQGHIQVHSVEGDGTSVELFLPRAAGPFLKEQAAPEPGPKSPGLASDVEKRPERILMVEDDSTLRELVAAQLRRLGYHVVAASTGLEAIAVLQTNAVIDLLFTDIAMPGGMNGIMLAKMAALQRPNLPVLFTSGFAEGSAKELLAGSPNILLLGKPYRTEELALMVRQKLDRRILD